MELSSTAYAAEKISSFTLPDGTVVNHCRFIDGSTGLCTIEDELNMMLVALYGANLKNMSKSEKEEAKKQIRQMIDPFGTKK